MIRQLISRITGLLKTPTTQYRLTFEKKIKSLKGDRQAQFEFIFACACEAQSIQAHQAGLQELRKWPRKDLVRRLEAKANKGTCDEWVFDRFYDLAVELNLPFRPVLQTNIT